MIAAKTNMKEYLNLHINNLKIDNIEYFQLLFYDFKDLEQRIPSNFRNKDFFEYTLTLYHFSFDSLEDFYEEARMYSSNILELEGKVIINIKKAPLLKSINKNIKNAFLFNDIDSIHKNTSIYEDIDLKYKVNVFLLNEIETISNDFININTFDEKLLNDFESKFVDEQSLEHFQITKETFGNKNIKHYHQVPHFWNFDIDNINLYECKKQCVINFFNLISNKIKIPDNEYVIKGHHNLTFKFDKLTSNINTQNFINLLDFTLDDVDRHLDKLLILRNVLTTYLNNLSTLEQFDRQAKEILATANHHLELYIQNEVKVFIEQKNHVLNETLTIAKLVSEQTVETSKHLRTLLITLFAAIIASFIPSAQDAFKNKGIIAAASVLYIIYLLFNYFIALKMEKQHENNLATLKNYIGYISSQSLNGLNYPTLKAKFIQREEDNLKNILKVYKSTIISLIAFSFFVLLILYFEYLSQSIN